jgi:YgiT-type zinc finger domain-containing protein
MICPDCESTNVSVHNGVYAFEYSHVTLCANIPVDVCNDCGASWIGEEAMSIRHNVVTGYMSMKEKIINGKD